MTEKQYEKWKESSEEIRENFVKICEEISNDWYVHKGDLSRKFFDKSKTTPYQINRILRGNHKPSLEIIQRDLDIYYSVML